MLTQQQIESFNRDGYLVVHELVDINQVLEPVKAEYTDRLRTLCRRWVEQKRLPAAAASGNFNQMIMAAIAAGVDYYQPLDISLPAGHITATTPFHAGPAVFDLITYAPLLDAVESLLGPELTSNPIQHVRIKPPNRSFADTELRAHIVSSDWHQDRAVALAEADQSRMVTVSVAITDTTTENGCLQVIPGTRYCRIAPNRNWVFQPQNLMPVQRLLCQFLPVVPCYFIRTLFTALATTTHRLCDGVLTYAITSRVMPPGERFSPHLWRVAKRRRKLNYVLRISGANFGKTPGCA